MAIAYWCSASNSAALGHPQRRCFRTLFGFQFWHDTLRRKLGEELRRLLMQLRWSARDLEGMLAAQLRVDPLVADNQEKKGYGYNLRDCLEELFGPVFKESVINRYPECIVAKAADGEVGRSDKLDFWQSFWQLVGKLAWSAERAPKKRCGIQLADVYACVVSKRVLYLSEFASDVPILQRLLKSHL